MAIQTYTIGQTLTAQQMTALQGNDFNQTVSTKTSNYVLVAADKGTRVVMDVSTASTITVNTSLFSAGDTVILQNIGSNASVVTPGTATVSSAGSLSIPQYGSGILYFTSAGVAIFFPSAVTASSGAVVQVKSTTLTSTFSGTATLGTFMAVTGLTVAITPTSASNKILLLATVTLANDATSQGLTGILTGGNCANYRGDAAGDRQRAASGVSMGSSARVAQVMSFNYVDSPATTSVTTYGVSINYTANSGATQVLYVNRAATDDDVNYNAHYASTITAIEVTP
jgi:hypothetical protein